MTCVNRAYRADRAAMFLQSRSLPQCTVTPILATPALEPLLLKYPNKADILRMPDRCSQPRTWEKRCDALGAAMMQWVCHSNRNECSPKRHWEEEANIDDAMADMLHLPDSGSQLHQEEKRKT